MDLVRGAVVNRQQLRLSLGIAQRKHLLFHVAA
jgi:hypothetical protein